MTDYISTRDVCARADVTEPALRHILRRPGAPRPTLHPTAHVFLWTERDVAELLQFLRRSVPTESERQQGGCK
jgi:hypothetical protein